MKKVGFWVQRVKPTPVENRRGVWDLESEA